MEIDATPETELSYENQPPFKIADNLMVGKDDEHIYNEAEEHIYNEAEVEEYLAAKYAQSRQLFESSPETLPEPQPEEPIYENIAPIGRGSQVKSGPYMTMDFSNSSMQSMQSHPSHFNIQRQPSSDIRMHSYPSPVGNRRPIVIDLSTDFLPNSLPRRSDIHRPSYEMRPSDHGPLDRSSNSLEQSRSSTMPVHQSTPKRTPVYQGPVNHNISPEKQRLLGPFRAPPSAASSVLRNASMSPVKNRSSRKSPSKDRGDGLSPRKNRSPVRYVSPERTTFRFGTSYGCNHAH